MSGAQGPGHGQGRRRRPVVRLDHQLRYCEALVKQGFNVNKAQVRMPQGPAEDGGRPPADVTLHSDVTPPKSPSRSSASRPDTRAVPGERRPFSRLFFLPVTALPATVVAVAIVPFHPRAVVRTCLLRHPRFVNQPVSDPQLAAFVLRRTPSKPSSRCWVGCCSITLAWDRIAGPGGHR